MSLVMGCRVSTILGRREVGKLLVPEMAPFSEALPPPLALWNSACKLCQVQRMS